jgi:hypothetical protein
MSNYKGTCFLAYRPTRYKGESKIENVALSKIMDTSSKNLEDAYNSSLLSNRLKDSTMLIKEQGVSKKGDYRWYISTHMNHTLNQETKSITVIYYIKTLPYTLKCTASVLSFNEYKNTFLKIAASIQFK